MTNIQTPRKTEDTMNIAKIMTPKYNTACLQDTSSVRQGLELMNRHGYTAIPVLNSEGKYIGSVTEGDFLRHITGVGTTELKEHEKYLVGDIFRPTFCPALDIHASEQQVIDAVLEQNYVPIVDDRGCLCGIVTRRSVILYLAEKLHPSAEKKSAAPVGCS